MKQSLMRKTKAMIFVSVLLVMGCMSSVYAHPPEIDVHIEMFNMPNNCYVDVLVQGDHENYQSRVEYQVNYEGDISESLLFQYYEGGYLAGYIHGLTELNYNREIMDVYWRWAGEPKEFAMIVETDGELVVSNFVRNRSRFYIEHFEYDYLTNELVLEQAVLALVSAGDMMLIAFAIIYLTPAAIILLLLLAFRWLSKSNSKVLKVIVLVMGIILAILILAVAIYVIFT